MIGRNVLIIHGVSPEAWAKRHDLAPYTRPCQDCGAPKTSSVPFARGQLRGLMAPPCKACGSDARTPYCVVRAAEHGDLFDGDLTGKPRR